MKHNDYVNEQVNQKDFFIKKKYSQNFLLDENIIQKIIKSAGIDQNTNVIEIGPGFGALTKYLIKESNRVLLYEVDQELIPHLENLFKKQENIHIINQDFLSIDDIDADIKSYLGNKKVVVLSNLPYHITTPIIMKILEESQMVKRLVLMMQLEVAKRLTSEPNSKDYNALSMIIQDQTKAKYLFKVPKTVFHPKPKVDSAVIRLDVKENHKKDPNFYQFLHASFKQRRKTLINNLHGHYAIDKDQLKNVFNQLSLDDRIRAEALNLEQMKVIYNYLLKEEYI